VSDTLPKIALDSNKTYITVFDVANWFLAKSKDEGAAVADVLGCLTYRLSRRRRYFDDLKESIGI